MPKSRPPYPEQFRREALELVRQGRSIPDVAESLGITAQSLRNWKVVRTSVIAERGMTG